MRFDPPPFFVVVESMSKLFFSFSVLCRVGDVESDGDVLMERQMDRCLIQLQTLASIVSIALKRTEYL